MAYVLRDGVAIYYEVHGDGPAMLLAHGFTATGRMWAPQIDLLAKTHKVIVWDMRGHGRSDSPADPLLYSEMATLADMAAILDAVGAERAVVGGHSLGGYMSLAFHRDHRDRVAGLILCGTGPGYRKDETRDAWNGTANRIGDLLQQNGLSQLEQFGAESVARNHKSVEGLVHAARGMLTQRDGSVIATLETITVPTLVAVGAEDAGYLTGCRYMATKIPGADLVLFEGSGHAPNLERTAEFNAALEAFVDARLTPLGI
jgi:pimeloyl-ACP methyl ester carboxylesterase